MKITKFGHSCLLVEENGVKILFDPGEWSDLPVDLSSIDRVLITHNHGDHLDPEKIKVVLAKNPNAIVMTNEEVGKTLTENQIPFQLLEDGESETVNGVIIEGFGKEHALVHLDIPVAKNTGYLINSKLWHPGDSLLVPPKPVSILALPIVAPWEKVSETMDYLTTIKPEYCVPIHDAFLKFEGLYDRFARMWCEKIGAKYVELPIGQEVEI